MAIPLVPYEGRMSYCLIKCLQMVLAHQGHAYPLPWLECVSGEPFGFVYVRTGHEFFAVNGYEYHKAGEHLLRTLNYAYTYTGAADDAAGLAALEDALREGPVAVGMLDMGFLTYAPTHQQARGADHAVVVLALRPDSVLVHDPDGYPAVPLPLADFLEAWKRHVYTGKPYGLWRIRAQGTPPDDETIWRRTLERARENFARPTLATDGGITLLFGPEGMRTLAADMRADPDRQLGGMAYFSWRVSGQRCLDSAMFLRERLPGAAAIRWEQCQVYGALQQASAAGKRAALPALLDQLAEQEERFIAALG